LAAEQSKSIRRLSCDMELPICCAIDFGLVVLAGYIIDILANLFVLPLLGGAQLKKRV